MNMPPEENNDIDDFLNKKLEEPNVESQVVEEKSVLKIIEERIPMLNYYSSFLFIIS